MFPSNGAKITDLVGNTARSRIKADVILQRSGDEGTLCRGAHSRRSLEATVNRPPVGGANLLLVETPWMLQYGVLLNRKSLVDRRCTTCWGEVKRWSRAPRRFAVGQ
jgi:hypothetical protein